MPEGIEAQTAQSLANVRAIRRAADRDLSDVVKTTVFMTDLADFAAMNEVYAGYFSENPPARSCVQVAALPKGATVEIEMLAVSQVCSKK
jgi:2-iminobutanoate/2-iminopropanoate deaminase